VFKHSAELPISITVSVFLDNARELFEVAIAGAASDDIEFEMTVRPDGSLHMVMESGLDSTVGAGMWDSGVQYRVTRSRGVVRVEGSGGGQRCVLQEKLRVPAQLSLLRDQALYFVAPTRMISSAS
jgi:hypothetical protein